LQRSITGDAARRRTSIRPITLPYMKWTTILPGNNAERSLAWMRRFLERYDTTAVESLRIDRGHQRYEGVYGNCIYPTKARSTFRINCHAPGPFPSHTVTRKRPLYCRPDGSFPRTPRGCRRGVLCYDPHTGRQWYRLRGKTQLKDLDQAIVWIVAHEAFHFLRHTRQVPGRNTEIDADAFADNQLEQFHAPSLQSAFLFI